MGIKSLMKLIQDKAPHAVRERKIAEMNGRKIAIDASMYIYQFLVAVRSAGDAGAPAAMLTNEAGEVTSHLQGMFARTIRMIENGIKPVYVFDGKPPDMKSSELQKRADMKAKAEADAKKAEEAGNVEDMEKFSRRTVHMTRQHQDEAKKLLRLLGVPVVEAPGEAEAQCAILAKAGKVFAAGSDDMDTLTFGTPKLVRRLNVSESRKLPLLEIDLPKVLEGFEFTMDQFIDCCMLCGCDYLDPIKGVGPKSAHSMIAKFGDLESAMGHIKGKYPVPESWDWKRAKALFKGPEASPAEDVELKWTDADEAGIMQYLVKEKQFAEERVTRSLERLRAARAKGHQPRMDSFFGIKPSAGPAKGGAKSKAKGKAKAKGKGSGKSTGGILAKRKAAAAAKPEAEVEAGAAEGSSSSSSSSSAAAASSSSSSSSASSSGAAAAESSTAAAASTSESPAAAAASGGAKKPKRVFGILSKGKGAKPAASRKKSPSKKKGKYLLGGGSKQSSPPAPAGEDGKKQSRKRKSNVIDSDDEDGGKAAPGGFQAASKPDVVQGTDGVVLVAAEAASGAGADSVPPAAESQPPAKKARVEGEASGDDEATV